MCNNKDLRIIQYLGSKVNILPDLKKVLRAELKSGSTVVDLFAGTGVVGNCLKDDYKIIANDIQEYSYLMNKVLLVNKVHDATVSFSIGDLYNSDYYNNNYNALSERYEKLIIEEDRIIRERDFSSLSLLTQSEIYYNNINHLANINSLNCQYVVNIFGDSIKYFSNDEVKKYQSDNKTFPYSLFSLYYLNSYFGIRQCVEIDSLRYAIDNVSENEYKSDDLKQILLACLLHSISETVSSVGKQFAQPIKTVDREGKLKNFAINRCMSDRAKSIRTYMEKMYERLSRLENNNHSDNEVFNLEYNELFSHLEDRDIAAFYIDPPYTIDHYSRFYHIPETLIKYDYPKLETKKIKGEQLLMRGRYREDRFQSNFCIPSKVKYEFNKMISAISKSNAKIIMSYSDHDDQKETRKRVITRDELIELLSEYYNKVEVINIEHKYRKLNKSASNKDIKEDSELLIICS